MFKVMQKISMVKDGQITTSISFLCFAIALFLFSISYFPVGVAMKVGLDASYQFAFNYFFVHHLIVGKQVYFTYGPLGFLMSPQPLGNNLLIGIIFWITLQILFLYFLLRLFVLANAQADLWTKALAFIALIFLSTCESKLISGLHEYLFFLLAVTLSLLFNIRKTNYCYLISAVLIASVGFLIKPGIAVIALLAIYSYGFFYLIIERKFKPFLVTLLSALIIIPLLWLVIYHSLAGLLGFLISTGYFIIGNSSAMTINPSNQWVYFLLAMVFYVANLFAFKEKPFLDKNGAVIFFIFLLPIYAWFKYSFSREDGHVLSFYFFISLVCLYLLTVVGDKKKILQIVVFSLISLFFLSEAFQKVGQDTGEVLYINLSGWKYLRSNIINYKQYKADLVSTSADNLKSALLPTAFRKKIGRQPVDTFPWDKAAIAANYLNWEPLPVFQAYVAYTPYLDHLNADFLAHGDGPKYIIWGQDKVPYGPMDDIDARYLLSTAPATTYAILNHYKLVLIANAKLGLLEKTSQSQLSEPVIFHKSNVAWNSWVLVPRSNYSIVRAKIFIKRNILGAIIRTIYKEDTILINYKFDSGKILVKRLVIDTAKEGVWINPFMDSLSNSFFNVSHPLTKNRHIIAVRLVLGKRQSWCYKKPTQIEWEGVNKRDGD